jgi:hypothetical protein
MNSSQNYRILIEDFPEISFRRVKGVGFKVVKHPKLKPFVWQHDGLSGIKANKTTPARKGNELRGFFCASDSETGCALSDYYPNPEQAVYEAIKYLNGLSEEQVTRAIKRAREIRNPSKGD